MIQEINTHTAYKVFFDTNDMRLGKIPPEKLLKIFSSGRQCGVLLEYDVVERFSNLSKDGCGQGDGADLFLLKNDKKTIQCKTVRLLTEKGIQKKEDTSIGEITKSSLFDQTRGKKLKESIWDDTHNSYFTKYDYFMFIDISSFEKGFYQVLLIPTEELKNHTIIETQQKDYHFGKKKKIIHASYPPTNWMYPKSLTVGMWNSWCLNTEKVYE